MRQSVADFYMGDMQAVLATLKWCAENRDLIVKLKAENTRLRAELEGMPGDSKCSKHLCPDCDHTQK
jgi:hypothetical protein